MTAGEVQDYLDRGGDTMFIAVGVVECHGLLPIDCETILPEAYAKLLAEKADGLAMINLPYFYPGGTVISNATVSFSIRDGIDYLNKICHSLVAQGFRKLFILSGHAPASLTVNAFCRDFFEETLIHPCHLMQVAKASGVQLDFGSNDIFYGAYKIMGQMEYLPVDPSAEHSQPSRTETDPAMERFSRLYQPLGGYISRIYSDPAQHSGGRLFRSEEERLEYCSRGEALLREIVDKCNINELKKALGEYQNYIQEMYARYPRIKAK
jgi:creatinine amidohydrolase